MKKLLTAVPLVLMLCSATVFASNNVSEIDIDVTVMDDGSAYIVQNWKGTFDEGTENYIPINTDDISVTDFKVSDKNGAYTFVENWDVDLSFDEKARKCGINETYDGIELCFGISDYGENRYAIEYDSLSAWLPTHRTSMLKPRRRSSAMASIYRSRFF